MVKFGGVGKFWEDDPELWTLQPASNLTRYWHVEEREKVEQQ